MIRKALARVLWPGLYSRSVWVHGTGTRHAVVEEPTRQRVFLTWQALADLAVPHPSRDYYGEGVWVCPAPVFWAGVRMQGATVTRSKRIPAGDPANRYIYSVRYLATVPTDPTPRR